MTHRVKRPAPTPELVDTGAICLQLGISQDYLKNRRIAGELRQSVHFITLPGSTKILWNVEIVRDWLFNGGESESHRRACEKFLKSLPSSGVYHPSTAAYVSRSK